ncbi:tetratricopeptide repeat-containing sensor histidine kinase [Flavobacterium chilense]|uniref:histidine kinase n=1 Tax=Flavobacterium chilense TaxID=946677 RepID=A0A1M7G1S3_9FLAO|nr:tetratricopeptide repeat-containing sensor histidine kinase [Flavobacterium chilense]SHM10028.1 hypothetical protein SAMN05444484_1047 [Flavobacterium chilense]
MILPRIHLSLYIVFIFLLLLSCQKKDIQTVKYKNSNIQIDKFISKANRFYDNNELDSAFLYYNKAKFICSPVRNTETYVHALNQMAYIQQNQGDFVGSESTAIEVISYLKYIKNPEHVWNTYIILGINYLNTYDFKNALLYFNKALVLKTPEWKKVTAKSNIALVYIEQQKYNRAIQVFDNLLAHEDIKKNPEDYAQALDNLGFCYYKIGDVKAEAYLQKALNIRLQTNDNTGQAKSHLHLAYLQKDKNPSLSKKHLILSYEKYTLVNHIDGRLTSLKQLIEDSSGKELKKYSVRYVELIDSIFEIRQKAKNQFAKMKYDSKKEKDENLILKTYRAQNELQLEKQKNRNIVSYILIFLSLSLILVLYFYLTSRGNREKIEATYQSETRISKKLHDELANDIYHTMAFAENKNLSVIENKEQLLNNLDTIYSRTRDISKENSPIITDENYCLYLKDMIIRFNTAQISVLATNIDGINWNQIDTNKKITVYRVLQELLVNMKKHSNSSLVNIDFVKTDRNVIINYIDNGKGIDINNITLKNGLYNIENRVLSIKGTIDIDSAPGKGFKAFFKFPV